MDPIYAWSLGKRFDTELDQWSGAYAAQERAGNERQKCLSGLPEAGHSVLIKTDGMPLIVLVEPSTMIPRFWATIWTLSLKGRSLSNNAQKQTLGHLDVFYSFCDARFGRDSLDTAISSNDVLSLQGMAEAFYQCLTCAESFTTTTVQRWSAIKSFLLAHTRRFGVGNADWRALDGFIEGMGNLRSPKRGRFKFVRALPAQTLNEILEIAVPSSNSNPFKDVRTQWRNWLILNLLLLGGLRRGETSL